MGEIKLKAEVLAYLAIFSVLLLFCLYYYTAKRKILLEYFIKSFFPSRSEESLEFISYKLTGILFTGIIPFVVFVLIMNVSPSGTGLLIGRTFQFWYLLIILIIITGLVSFKSSKSRKIQEMSPELKIRDWYPRHIILSVSAWLFYILGYEFLFRGILWFPCSEAFGFWPALFINLLLYSLVHLPQGKLVAIGTLPVGIILCLLSHLTGSFIPAFLIHSLIAVLTDLFSLYHNPAVHLHPIRTK
jgi:membrane protease YdiL (CAAX protease family)